MKLFSEKVKHTSTNSPLNIIKVENFEEIFFDVYEIEINKTKYLVESVCKYNGNPVVSIPINIGGGQIDYPFLLIKGKQEVLFNKNNTQIIEDVETTSSDNNEDFEILNEYVENDDIFNQIKIAKNEAKIKIDEYRKQTKRKILEESKNKEEKLSKILSDARDSLVDEFTKTTNNLKEELYKESSIISSKNYKILEEKIDELSLNLKNTIKNDFKKSTEKFDDTIKHLVIDIYNEQLSPIIDKELESIALDVVKKVDNIETNLIEKLSSKVDKNDLVNLEESINNITSSNIDLNNKINKGVNKALSRVGNVDSRIDKLTIAVSDSLDSKVSLVEENIKNYYEEKINLIEQKNFDLTESTRKYILELISESKDSLVEDIRKIKNQKPIEYIVESKSGDKKTKSLESIEKDFDKIISSKIDNEVTRLRKYISVYSGGGSVAMQFADGGVMNGSLTVNGNITASGDVSGVNGNLSRIAYNTTYTPTGNEPIGSTYWNSTDGTLDLVHDGATQQIGQEMYIKVRNTSGSTINNGLPVYFNGRTGNRPNIGLAQSNSDSTSMVMGVTTQDIPNNSDGFITTFGYVRQIKTNYTGSGNWGNTWNEGDKLYVSKTVAGQLTNIEPTVPHHSDVVGEVGIVGNVGIGSIFIQIDRHKTLEKLSDVNGTPLTTSGQIPTWNQTSGYFDFDKNLNNYATLSGTLTNGSVLFSNISGSVVQDNNNLFWNNVNKRLGVGTKIPSQKLTLASTGDTSMSFWSGTGTIGTPGSTREARITAVSTGGGGNGHSLAFLTNISGGNPTEYMRITSTGNVGIGTTGPLERLHISGGNVRVQNTFGLRYMFANNTHFATLYMSSNNRLIYNSQDQNKFAIGKSGQIWKNGVGEAEAQMGFQDIILNTGQPATIGVVVKTEAVTPTADLTQWRDRTNTILASISPTGNAYFAGNVGIGNTTPSATLHIKAGTETAGTAPIKLTAGTNLTTVENGTFEFDGTNLYFTVGGVRRTVSLI